jgi:hypothetical protein
MTNKRNGAVNPFEALEQHFNGLAESKDAGVDTGFWRRASEVDYRSDSPFQYDMEWKDVSVLVNALKDNKGNTPDT